MVQDGDRDCSHVVEANGGPSVEERERAGRFRKRDRCPWRCAVLYVLRAVRRGDESSDPRGDGVGQHDARGSVECARKRVLREREVGVGHFSLRPRRNDRRQRRGVGRADAEAEEESVGLRLGERIRSLELYRVLACEDEEGGGQRTRHAHKRDGALLHSLEHRRLRLRRGAVDFVREQDVAEDGAGLEDHLAAAVGGGLQDVRAEDVAGHEVGRELHALEVELQDVAHGLHERGLAEAGQAFEEDVTAREDAGEDEPVQFVAAEQDAVELGERALERLADGRDFLRGRQGRLRGGGSRKGGIGGFGAHGEGSGLGG